MAADAEQLLVTLTADLSAYAPALAQGSALAQAASDNIVQSFAQANSKLDPIFASISGGLGKALLLGGAGAAAGGALAYLNSLEDEFGKFELAAKKASLSLQDFQALRLVGGANGVSGDSFDAGVASFADKLNDSVHFATQIEALFKKNGIDIDDNNGKLKDTKTLLQSAADLIANAATYQDKVNFASTLGFSPDFIPMLEQGGAAIAALADQASTSGGVIDDEIIHKAAEFDREWKSAISTWTADFKAAIVDVAEYIESLIGGAIQKVLSAAAKYDLGRLSGKYNTDKGIQNFTEDDLNNLVNDAKLLNKDLPSDLQTDVNARAKALGLDPTKLGYSSPVLNAGTVHKPLPTGQSTQYGDPLKSGGKKSDPFADEEVTIQKRIDLLNQETAAVGLGVGAMAKAKAEVDLLTAAKKAGLPITDEMKTKIDAEATAVGVAAQAYADAKLKQSEWVSLQNFAGGQISGFFTSIVTGSATAEQALKQLLDALVQAAAQALLLGKGPLGAIYGIQI